MKKQKSSRTETVAGTSYSAEYITGVCSYIARHLRPFVPEIPLADRPKLMKTVLEDMAKPFGNYKPWEIGKGLVTQSIAEKYMQSVSKERIKQLSDIAINRW
jgi:hypothetical protein